MSILDGIGNYLSSVSYTPTQSTTTAEEVKNDAVATGLSSVQTSRNFDTVEISVAGRAYQSQSDTRDQTGESAGGLNGAKGKKAPPPPPKEETTSDTSTVEEEDSDQLLELLQQIS